MTVSADTGGSSSNRRNNKNSDRNRKYAPYCCDDCDKEFTKGKDFKIHRESLHLQYYCLNCHKEYEYHLNFEEHLENCKSRQRP